MLELQTPPRPSATPPLEGRGVPHGVPSANDGAAAPLPSRGGVAEGRGGVSTLIIPSYCLTIA